jgi:hypothetical protein
MKERILVGLTREARKTGGDRYENQDKTFTVYVPQHISRAETPGKPEPILYIVFASVTETTEEKEGGH